MSEHINTFFFGIYPYIAVGSMIFGSILRYDRDPYSWKADSSQLMSRKGLRWGSNLFHVGILLLFFGHLVGLLTPHWAYEPFITAGQKQDTGDDRWRYFWRDVFCRHGHSDLATHIGCASTRHHQIHGYGDPDHSCSCSSFSAC